MGRFGARDGPGGCHHDPKTPEIVLSMLFASSIVASAFSPAVPSVGFATAPVGRAAVITAAAKPELLVYDRKH